MGLFDTFEKDKKIEQLEDVCERIKRNKNFEIEDLRQEYALELRDKEFELKHFKDTKVAELEKRIVALESENAVLKKENNMMDQIVDMNADIVDVKDLVNKLIDKLPTMDFKNLTVQANSSKR